MSAASRIEYSEKYADETHEYRYVGMDIILPKRNVQSLGNCKRRSTLLTVVTLAPTARASYCSHVILPKELAKTLSKSRLLTENEWRGIGVQQSRGWQHYAMHRYVRTERR